MMRRNASRGKMFLSEDGYSERNGEFKAIRYSNPTYMVKNYLFAPTAKINIFEAPEGLPLIFLRLALIFLSFKDNNAIQNK